MSNNSQNKTAPCVLQILPRLGVGGVERTTLDISRALAAAGWRSIVASAGGILQGAITRDGSKHITLPLHSKNPAVVLANVARLSRCIRKHRVDILHARSRMPAWSALMASRWCGIPFVTTYHSTVYAAPAWKRWYNSVMTRGDVVTAASHYNGGRIRRAHGDFRARLEVIVAGIDMDTFDPARHTSAQLLRLRASWGVGARIVAMLPGRLDKNKGHEVFIEALARMKPPRPLGVIVGGSAKVSGRIYQESLHQRVKALGLEGDVVFAGAIDADEIPLAYAAADIIVAPSVFAEPFGRVAVEAQAMERVIIASDIGGFRETICTSPSVRTGWLVEVGNAEALARALGEVVALEASGRIEIGRRSRADAVAKFSLEQMCEKTLKLYRQLLS